MKHIAPNPSTLSAAAHSSRGALGAAAARLEAAGVPSAALAAELLLMHVLGRDRAWLYAHPEDSLDADQAAAFAQLVERRAGGEPSQYLTGRQEFWSLDFEVTTDVLIPRPETEHLVEVALARLGARRAEPLRVADVGTGSGCLAVALARECPRARVTATDISARAIAVARRNAARHGSADRIHFVRMNILKCFVEGRSAGGPRFDLIVSNPPYVALADARSLQREVREHEPPQALFAGEDGLGFYPQLFAQAEALLMPGGLLVVELGHGQAARVRDLLGASAWRDVTVERDLAGIERVISAERASRA